MSSGRGTLLLTPPLSGSSNSRGCSFFFSSSSPAIGRRGTTAADGPPPTGRARAHTPGRGSPQKEGRAARPDPRKRGGHERLEIGRTCGSGSGSGDGGLGSEGSGRGLWFGLRAWLLPLLDRSGRGRGGSRWTPGSEAIIYQRLRL